MTIAVDLGRKATKTNKQTNQISFLVAKLKPLIAKRKRASLAREAVINFSIPRAPYQLAIPLSNL